MQPALSIIVPVYNEERTLKRLMDALVAACPHAEIVYVNDGSTDASQAILDAGKRGQDVVLTKPNGGKGSAIRLGLLHASGRLTVIQDADLEYDPTEIALLEAEAMNDTTAVFGSRFLQPNPNIYKRYLLGNRMMTLCLNILFRSHITDSYTCYKLLPTAVFQSLDLQSNGFEMEAEICAKCLKRGIAIREVPISYRPRSIAEGKKIGWKDAVKGVWMMGRVRCGQ